MLEDYSQRQHIAEVDSVTGLWLKAQVIPLFGPSVLFSQTFPASGTMHDGKVYELPMRAHHITDLESLSSPIPEDSMLRTPSAIEGEGGAITESQSRERGRMLQVRDQMAQLAAENGLKVSDGIANSLLPTPAVGHIRNYDEPIEDYLARRKKRDDGEYRGMPGVSLGVAVRMEMLPTVKARDSNPEGYEAGLRRGMPQLGTMVKAIVDGDDRLDLLPTPNTMEHREIKTPEQIAELKAKSPGGYRNLRESVVNELLPTPIVRDYKDGSAAQERDGKVSVDTVARAIFNSGEVLLGTPRTSSAHSLSSKQVENGADKARLEDQVRSANEGYISWGKFEPAIRRWEQVMGRPAPPPTKPDGKDGNHRLAAEFTEWMMGLNSGHVTDPKLGLSRVEMLKLCGNGVVPQQAALALTRLLTGIDFGGKNESDLVMPTLTTNGTGRHSAGYDSLGTLQMLEVAKGILPKEYDSWQQVNGKIPAEWRDGKAVTGGGRL